MNTFQKRGTGGPDFVKYPGVHEEPTGSLPPNLDCPRCLASLPIVNERMNKTQCNIRDITHIT